MGHFISQPEKLHSFLLGLQVQQGDWVTEGTVRGLTASLASKSTGVAAAAGRAVGIVDSGVHLQAYALTFVDAFHLVAWACVATLLLTAVLRRPPRTSATRDRCPRVLLRRQGAHHEHSQCTGVLKELS
jgi:hypothetical protein